MSTPLPPPADDDDNPEWTEEDFARARPAAEVLGREKAALILRRPGPPCLPPSERKQPVSIRLSPDVLQALRDSGDGWQTRVDEILREALLSPPQRSSGG
ncbi:BrnA antitoxin family protein [Altericroceibacterium xinjiangense]|uniref:BrnA antitoxin family protein n=1 Tax=Altericroceibacterium xinjiangense TaxID=762261 RepID=UPI000F7E4FB4|nr:BrnA antitoxin family protein [Altericroceibacterium xinjiangense]